MRKLRRQSYGFTLVEMLVSLTLLGVVTAGTAVYLANLDKSRYRMEAIATRDAIGLRLKRLTTLSIIEYSASSFSDPGNAALKSCLRGPSCTATNPLQPVAFNMAYPRSGEVVRIAGTDESPVIYCHDGREKTAENRCAAEWEARAYFFAFCAFGAGQCERATAIRVSHKLVNNKLKDQPLLDGLGLKDEASGVFTIIQVPQGPKTTPNPCNQYSVIDKVDQNGVVTCVCLEGMRNLQNPINGQPTCAPKFENCTPPAVTVGYQPNLVPKCAIPAPPTELSNLSDQCNGFITDVRVSGCTSTTSGGGGKGDFGSKGGGGTMTTICAQEGQTCVKSTPQ